MMGGMKPPLFVRSLTAEEHAQLKAALLNRNAFIARRAQVVLASARGERPRKIAANLGCATQTVRTAIRDFTARGVECLVPRSSRPKSARRILDEEQCEKLRAILHDSPRSLGKEQSLWTPAAVAEVACCALALRLLACRRLCDTQPRALEVSAAACCPGRLERAGADG